MSTHEYTSPRLPALAVAVGCVLLAVPVAHAAEERFRLLPGAFMQNDDAGVEGTQGHARGLGYEVMQGYAIAEGDMVLGRVDHRGLLEAPFRPRGLGQRGKFDRWPDGIVPYAYHPSLSAIQQANVEEALARLNSRTRISLVPADSAEAAGYDDYVLFEPSNGCASYVGRQLTENAQSLWVADSCSVGSIVHEIAHAIGLFHEHTRPDRDNKVTIAWDEIIENKAFNFEIYDDGAESWGQYDYGSIMHYGEYFFSRSGERTIIAPANTDIGQRVELSATDIETIDRMYATDLALDTTVFESDRGLEIDISTSNLGDLGARGLTLRVRGEIGTDWLSVSADSGWECLAHEEELRCKRTRLLEQASSRFTVVADPATASADSIVARLDSVTLDADPGNNGAKAEVFGDEDDAGGQSVTTPPEAPAAARPVEPTPTEPSASTTDTPAASPASARSSAATDTSGGGAGGGGASAFAPLALIGLLAARRRRGRVRARPGPPPGSSPRTAAPRESR